MIDSPPTAVFDGPLVAGRYQLGPLLGKGSQGSTYLAQDRQEERVVAVKEFDLSQAVEWKQFELFQRECAVLQRLDHPGIPKYLDHFQSEDSTRHYLIMEFIPGESLKEIVKRRGPLGEKDLWRILIQVVDILSYLHDQDPPIVHRDIKPGNLIQRANGEIYLVDFGGARMVIRADGGSTVVGTFGYMAPEQLHGQATPATDLYALGATLLNLGTGIEPEDFPHKGLKIDFPDLLQVSPDLTEALRDMLEPDPDHRPPSAIELKELVWPSTQQGLDSGTPSSGPVPSGAQGTVIAPSGSARSTDVLGQKPQPLPVLAGKIPEGLALFAGLVMVLAGFAAQLALWTAARILVPILFALLSLFLPRSQRTSLRETRRSLQKGLLQSRPLFQSVAEQGKIEVKRGQAWWNNTRLPGPPAPPRPPQPPPPRPTWTDQRWPWEQYQDRRRRYRQNWDTRRSGYQGHPRRGQPSMRHGSERRRR